MASRRGKTRDKLKGVRPIGINMAFSEEEAEILHGAADKDKSSLQYWARTRLLAAAKVESGNQCTDFAGAHSYNVKTIEKADEVQG